VPATAKSPVKPSARKPSARKAAARKASARKTSAAPRSVKSAHARVAKDDHTIRRVSKSLDAAHKDLTAIGTNLGAGAGDLRKDVVKLLRDARRDVARMGAIVRRDLERLQKDVRAASTVRPARAAKPRRASSARRASSTTSRAKSGPARTRKGA
jgi:hypothetical protein